MSRLSILALACGMALASSARADEWNKRYSVGNAPDLRVETGDGNIELRSGSAGVIEARVVTQGYKIADDGVRIVESQTGDMVRLEVRLPRWEGFNLNNRWVRIELALPPGVRAELRTGDGNIRGRDVNGDLRCTTGDGNIDMAGLAGALEAHTGDGSIVSSGRFERLNLRTGDGRIEASAAEGSKVDMPWRISTGDGAVTLRVPPSLSADLDLKTGDGGISVDVPVTTNGRVSGNRFRGRMNAGGPLVSVSTGDGAIRIARM